MKTLSLALALVGIGLTALPARPPTAQESPAFTHSDHDLLDCTDCHATDDGHGILTVTTIGDCRSCHHTPPESDSCERCHAASEAPTGRYRVVRAVRFTVGTSDPSRTLTFPHPPHAQLVCASCHTQGLALGVAADLDCTGCHREHHTPQSDCASCHPAAPVEAHPPSEAHVTCSGAECHREVPFEGLPRTRAFCLGCHQTMREHEPGQTCAECHRLPPPRT